MRIGIIGSSGGSALKSAVECLKIATLPIELFVVSDRKCGIYDWAIENHFDAEIINYEELTLFSSKALEYFKSKNVVCVLLFFTRKIGAPLVGGIPVYNIHPSLLPSFKGLHGVRDALRKKVRILGCSLHVVDLELDSGEIIGQITCGLPVEQDIISVNKISYLQKVYLTLVLYELLTKYQMKLDLYSQSVTFNKQPPYGLNVSPTLSNLSLLKVFNRIEDKEGVKVV